MSAGVRCDGPDCGTFKADSVPGDQWVGVQDFHPVTLTFCGWRCLLKYAAKKVS